MNKKIKTIHISKKILSLFLILLIFLSGCINNDKEDTKKDSNEYYEGLPNNYLYNGYINVNSKINIGTTMTLGFPILQNKDV